MCWLISVLEEKVGNWLSLKVNPFLFGHQSFYEKLLVDVFSCRVCISIAFLSRVIEILTIHFRKLLRLPKTSCFG